MSENIDDAFNVDPTPDSPDEEANEKLLQEQLHKYQEAIRSEWETTEQYNEGTLDPSKIRAKTKDLLTQAVPKAVASMLYLSQHAVNEQVKLKAATYIIDKAIGKESGLVGDPLSELLQDIEEAKGR